MAGALLAPEAVDLGAVGVSFILLCFCIVAFGMVKFATLLVQAVHFIVAHTVGEIPLVGSVVGKITGPIFASVERGLADAALGVEGAIGFYWHAIGHLVAWVAHELRANALMVWHLAHYALPWEWGHLIVRELGRLTAFVHAVQRTAVAALAGVLELERTFAHRVAVAVAPRFAALEHELAHVIYPDIAALRARARALTDRIDAVWHRVRRLEGKLTTAALTAAVAVALTALDLNWIRCRNWRRIGRGICGLPFELIDALLAGTLEAFAITDLCDLAGVMTWTAEQLRPFFLAWVDVEQALVGCHGATAPAPLGTPALHLPPLQSSPLLAA